jgi:hypothetical protein
MCLLDIGADLTRVVRDAGRKRIPSRLGRQGAMRKRRGEVYEMNGHKFTQQQFYNIMRCAFCSEFLLNAQGVQCEGKTDWGACAADENTYEDRRLQVYLS